MSAFRPEAGPRPESQESEPKPATIRLEFFRHDAKEKSSGPDEAVRLTTEGRQHATDVGKAKKPTPETSIAIGSSRDRARETALRHMLADEARVTGDASLEEIRQLIAEHVKIGTKERADERLNFNYEGTDEFKKVAFEHYIKEKDMLSWLHDESDQLVQKLSDKDSTSYSRLAGNVAEIVKKYVDIHPRWQEINARNPDKYAQFDNELQRHLGSHQTVPESFLMKVIEKREGSDGVDAFIKSLGDKNGFGFSEGYSVEIRDQNEIAARYRQNEWAVDQSLLDEIIAERDELDRNVNHDA